MLKYYFSLIFLCCFLSYTYPQTTYIADSRFETALINLGIDDVMDHSVLTSNISGVTYLDIRPANPYLKIYDLTGIEDFTSLQTLLCSGNALSTLDLSQNTALIKLECYENVLTSLDVSGSPNLDFVNCDLNQLTSLDVSANTKLKTLKCFSNKITSLDLTLNTSLTYLRCASNQLTSLNVKNGHNSLITSFDALNNSSLGCIDVDDATAANAGQAPYTNWKKDASATYSEDCSALGVEDNILLNSITFYPNPFTDLLTIDSKMFELNKVEIYSISGMKIKEVNSNFESIKTSNLSQGLYVLKIYTVKGNAFKKLIKN